MWRVSGVAWILTRIVSCHNMGRWLSYRDSLPLSLTGSGVGTIFGCGHETLNKYIHGKLSPNIKEKQFNQFEESAKDHGRFCESYAKECFLEVKHDNDSSVILFNGSFTMEVHSSIEIIQDEEKKSYEIIVLCTPDMVLKNGTIVEFKCPYSIIFDKRANGDMKKCGRMFMEKNPVGKEGAFLQAYLYAIVMGYTKVTTCFFFWDRTDSKASLVIYEYEIVPSDEYYTFYMRHICELNELMKNYHPDMKYRQSKNNNNKTNIRRMMAKYLLSKEISLVKVPLKQE